jgi:predicted aconitase with swiveling domain
MKIRADRLNGGNLEAQAFVVDFPFSFISDFDAQTGCLVAENHPLDGHSMAGKVLVCPEGRGGTMGPFILYEAMRRGNAPAAIFCDKIDPVLYEAAITIDIPFFSGFSGSIVQQVKNGQHVAIRDDDIQISA